MPQPIQQFSQLTALGDIFSESLIICELKSSGSPDFNLPHSFQDLKESIIREIANNSKQSPLCVEKYF
jgi:hypothetical protein